MFEDGSGEKRNEVDEEGKAWELVVALLGSCREEDCRRMEGILLWSLIISSFTIMVSKALSIFFSTRNISTVFFLILDRIWQEQSLDQGSSVGV